MNKEEIEALLAKCLAELEAASQGGINADRADKNAAMFLKMQILLADYLAEAEFKSKMAKSQAEKVAAEKYFEYKSGPTKMTEVALEQSVAKDGVVGTAKRELMDAESEYKKWNYLMGILANGHVLYRGLGKKEFN